MARLFLIRHGQASFGASNYDALSDVGRQQAQWLGSYFKERGISFSRIVSGELQRQKDTTTEILTGLQLNKTQFQVDKGFNEYDSDVLYSTFTKGGRAHDHQRLDRLDYWRTFRMACEAWITNQLGGPHETWAEFCGRIQRALKMSYVDTEKEDAILLVTSSGVIGSIVSELLETGPRSAIELNFQARNTSFCEIVVGKRQMRLISFNSISHLDRPGRREWITYV